MDLKEFQTRVCILRNELEELADEADGLWRIAEPGPDEDFLLNAALDLQAAANSISIYESQED